MSMIFYYHIVETPKNIGHLARKYFHVHQNKLTVFHFLKLMVLEYIRTLLNANLKVQKVHFIYSTYIYIFLFYFIFSALSIAIDVGYLIKKERKTNQIGYLLRDGFIKTWIEPPFQIELFSCHEKFKRWNSADSFYHSNISRMHCKIAFTSLRCTNS